MSGARLGNRFILRDRIGIGGMSEVWRAEDELLGRFVAVKVLTAATAADPTLNGASGPRHAPQRTWRTRVWRRSTTTGRRHCPAAAPSRTW
jgi:serine/threonine protein kinase